ncbi:hypothetical protein SDC9_136477 [bioreactor metagenome]|uniref:Uncharacterized protein n=1 Tax=bioreactor metagenome TaxID=1076179 RepID=A0A645DJZ0_9ZZZZ
MGRDEATADRGEHHRAHDPSRTRHTQQFQCAAIRAVAGLAEQRVVPRNQADDKEDGADVEQTDAPHHGIGGAHDLLGRVLRLGRGNGDDLCPQERKHHAQQGHGQRADAIGHEAAMRREMGKAPGLAQGPQARDGQHPHGDEEDDGHHLDEREPEFALAIVAHLQKVHADQQGRH